MPPTRTSSSPEIQPSPYPTTGRTTAIATANDEKRRYTIGFLEGYTYAQPEHKRALQFHPDYQCFKGRAPAVVICAGMEGPTTDKKAFTVKRAFIESSSDVFTKLLDDRTGTLEAGIDLPYSPATIARYLSFYTAPDPLALLLDLPDAGAYADLYAFARTYQVRLLLAALEGEGNRIWEGVVRKDPVGAYVVACFMEREAEHKGRAAAGATTTGALGNSTGTSAAENSSTKSHLSPTKIFDAVCGMHHAFYPLILESESRATWRLRASFKPNTDHAHLAPSTMGQSIAYELDNPARNLPATISRLAKTLRRPVSVDGGANPQLVTEMTARDVLSLSFAMEDGLARYARQRGVGGPTSDAEPDTSSPDVSLIDTPKTTDGKDDVMENTMLWGDIAVETMKQRERLTGMGVA